MFLILTIVTVFAKPVPLALGSPHLVQVENQLYMFAQSHWTGATSAWSNVRRLEGQMKDYGRSHLLPYVDDLAASQSRLVSYGASGYRGLELRVFRAAAALLDITWPVKRWPVYVFTAGAMLCLLTSTVCHLFGCCARHVSQVIWRFDYVGIALLIVCSFYPPVYYGQCLLLSCPSSYWCSAVIVLPCQAQQSNKLHILYIRCDLEQECILVAITSVLVCTAFCNQSCKPCQAACYPAVKAGDAYASSVADTLAFLPELWLV